MDRNKPLITVLAFMFLYVISCVPAKAIIIRHDRDDAQYVKLGKRFRAICHMNPSEGEGTLIAPQWVLTAAHVAQDVRSNHRLTILNKNYSIEKTIIHPRYRGTNNDIALIKLRKKVTGVRPVRLYREKDEVGQIVTIVGIGSFGTGRSGPMRKDGKLRGATNRIDRALPAWIIFKFDEPSLALDLEGVSGPGDSGGPAFIEKDGILYVAGVSSTQTFKGIGEREGVYGVLDYYARVSSYLDWIEQSIRENN